MNDLANPPLLRAAGLKKSYFRVKEVPVLRGVDLELRAGEFVSVTGSSGSGKSTLLHLLGGLDAADAGAIHWRGELLDGKDRAARDAFRNRQVGFVFQFYHLLPELSALENVLLPTMIRHSWLRYWGERRQLRARGLELLELVGLGSRAAHKPKELSGGEMQRTAIARALMARPELLLADEPTGNLDEETGHEIQDLLRSLGRDLGITVLAVTHDAGFAASADRQLRLEHGLLAPPLPQPVALRAA